MRCSVLILYLIVLSSVSLPFQDKLSITAWNLPHMSYVWPVLFFFFFVFFFCLFVFLFFFCCSFVSVFFFFFFCCFHIRHLNCDCSFPLLWGIYFSKRPSGMSISLYMQFLKQLQFSPVAISLLSLLITNPAKYLCISGTLKDLSIWI